MCGKICMDPKGQFQILEGRFQIIDPFRPHIQPSFLVGKMDVESPNARIESIGGETDVWMKKRAVLCLSSEPIMSFVEQGRVLPVPPLAQPCLLAVPGYSGGYWVKIVTRPAGEHAHTHCFHIGLCAISDALRDKRLNEIGIHHRWPLFVPKAVFLQVPYAA